MEHPHSAASTSSAAGPQRARAAGIERSRAAGLERTREAGLERARAAAREGARRLPGILAMKAQSARHRRRLAQAIRMNYAAAMASDEATNGTRSKVDRRRQRTGQCRRTRPPKPATARRLTAV